MAKNMEKLINGRIKESKEDLENNKSGKKTKASKMQVEDKQILRQQRNQDDGKAKNSGLKWSLEDKIKVKSLFKKDMDIIQISIKLERTTGAILGELFKSAVITKSQQLKLSELLKERPIMAKKSVLDKTTH